MLMRPVVETRVDGSYGDSIGEIRSEARFKSQIARMVLAYVPEG